jgi:hypothetical protein
VNQTPIERTFEAKFPVAGPLTLDVRFDAGALRVRSGEDGTVVVRGVLRRRESFFAPGAAERRMDELAANPPAVLEDASLRLGDAASGSLNGISALFDVTVPRATRVRAKSDSADFHLKGIDGPVECETDHGRIEASEIHSEVRVSSDHGNITIRNVDGPVVVRADHSSIEARDIAGRIDVRADSGSVFLSQTSAASIQVASDSGDVSIRLAGGCGYSVSLETDHGNLRFPQLENQQASGGRIRGNVRGGGPLVDARTDSGSIEIE